MVHFVPAIFVQNAISTLPISFKVALLKMCCFAFFDMIENNVNNASKA